jgi:hypothetical protein
MAAAAAPITPLANALRPFLLKLGFVTFVSVVSSDSLWPPPRRTTATVGLRRLSRLRLQYWSLI